MRWWECGFIGAAVLSLGTLSNAVRALLNGVEGTVRWSEALQFALAVFAMGFFCGVVAWSGKGLHRRFGALGDAVVGTAVMLAFFLCCMLLFAPQLLGPKWFDGGLIMLGVAAVVGAVGGVWVGHDIDDEATAPEE